MAYYRLRIIDRDGSFSFSPVVHLERMTIRVFPNPSSGYFTVTLPPAGGRTTELYLHDTTGRLVLRARTDGAYEHQTTLPAGVYFISADLASGRVTQRVVITGRNGPP